MALLDRITFPVVIKPTVLSASRGVIRADDALSFATAFDRVRRLLASAEVRELRDPEADVVQIEDYIPGAEYALEGLLENGVLRTLAIFDKPDPLDGPFFEETIYVTPSRVSPDVQRQIEDAVVGGGGGARAASRSDPRRVPRQRAAACSCSKSRRGRSAGCARRRCASRPQSHRHDRPQASIGFEELLLRNALGEAVDGWTRESRASAVMMIPIPRSGVYRRVEGLEAAGHVPARRGDPDHGQARSAAAGAAGRSELSGFHLREGGHAGAGGARGARRARAARDSRSIPS